MSEFYVLEMSWSCLAPATLAGNGDASSNCACNRCHWISEYVCAFDCFSRDLLCHDDAHKLHMDATTQAHMWQLRFCAKVIMFVGLSDPKPKRRDGRRVFPIARLNGLIVEDMALPGRL